MPLLVGIDLQVHRWINGRTKEQEFAVCPIQMQSWPFVVCPGT
jgi:hypothetical protein